MAGLAAELCMAVASALLYLAYHVWLFFIKGTGLHRVDTERRNRNLFAKGRLARVHFCEMICDANDTIAGLQQNRNCLLGVSFLAGTSSILAQKVLAIILDEAQVEQVRAYGVWLST